LAGTEGASVRPSRLRPMRSDPKKPAARKPLRRSAVAGVTTKASPQRRGTRVVAQAESKAAGAQTASGKTARGKTARGKTARGKTARGKTARGKTARGKTARMTAGSKKTPGVKPGVAKVAGTPVGRAVGSARSKPVISTKKGGEPKAKGVQKPSARGTASKGGAARVGAGARGAGRVRSVRRSTRSVGTKRGPRRTPARAVARAAVRGTRRVTSAGTVPLTPAPAPTPASDVRPRVAGVEARSVVRPTAPPRRPPRIPPLLLEGDASPAPAISGPGERFLVGPVAPSVAPVPSVAPMVPVGPIVPAGSTAPAASLAPGSLPEHYGTRRLFLSARDPNWLYAHWDLGEAAAAEYAGKAAGGQLVLRLYRGAPGTLPVSEIPLAVGARSWFLRLADGGDRYLAELGYWDKDGVWHTLATSEAVMVPGQPPRVEGPEEFATIPVDVPFSVIFGKVAEAVREESPLVEMISALRSAGYEELPSAGEAQAPEWTPEQERALAAVLRIDSERRVWVGSLDVTESVRERLAADLREGVLGGAPWGLAAEGAPSSPAAGFEASAAVKGEALGSEAAVPVPPSARKGKGFWFCVNAEIIVYGATEPDAVLTVGGRPVRLRPDGTFSLRFALPDGDFALPLRAVSRDGEDGREAQLQFRRQTDYHGQVGVHAQDPALKPPRPEHAADAQRAD
jgi:uncharacterized protein